MLAVVWPVTGRMHQIRPMANELQNGIFWQSQLHHAFGINRDFFYDGLSTHVFQKLRRIFSRKTQRRVDSVGLDWSGNKVCSSG